jgi:O-antigen/teichoic acid export membrane protein
MSIISLGTFFLAFEVIDFYFQSIVKSKFVSLSRITQLLLTSSIRIILIYYNCDLKYFILVSLFEQIFLAVSLSFAFKRRGGQNFYYTFDKLLALKLLNNAKPYIFSGIIIAIYTNIDKIFLSRLIDEREVGIYSSAVSLVAALNVIPYIISNSFFPALINAKERSEALYKSRLILLFRYLIFSSILFCLLVSFFSTEIIKLSFGQKYIASSHVLNVYVWNFVLISFSALFGKFLLAEGLQGLLTKNTLIAVIINIVANYFLIPIYSSRGAAFASLAAQFFPIIILVLSNRKIYLCLKSIFNIQINNNFYEK